MRPAVFASFFAAFLASACGDSMRIEPVTVQWMDWPWQVAYGQPFRTRLVVSGVCGLQQLSGECRGEFGNRSYCGHLAPPA